MSEMFRQSACRPRPRASRSSHSHPSSGFRAREGLPHREGLGPGPCWKVRWTLGGLVAFYEEERDGQVCLVLGDVVVFDQDIDVDLPT